MKKASISLKHGQSFAFKKEFDWNVILPKKDYTYFLDNRIVGHVNTFTNYLRTTSNATILMYLCIKNNGDLNAVILESKKIKNYPVTDNATSPTSIGAIFQSWSRTDVITGQLGEFIYGVVEKKKCYFIYKILLKNFVEKNKIIEKLKDYRFGPLNKTSANESFSYFFDCLKETNPLLLTTPFKKKNLLLLKHKFDEVQ